MAIAYTAFSGLFKVELGEIAEVVDQENFLRLLSFDRGIRAGAVVTGNTYIVKIQFSVTVRPSDPCSKISVKSAVWKKVS